MGRRWSYLKWKLQRNRTIILGLAGLVVVLRILYGNQEAVEETLEGLYRTYGVRAAGALVESWFPNCPFEAERSDGYLLQKPEIFEYLERLPKDYEYGEDPAYQKVLAGSLEVQVLTENQEFEQMELQTSQSAFILGKLADFDYVMKEFYSVHPTTTADRTLIDTESFLNLDLSIEKKKDQPQILIYHTHSQEFFADYPKMEEASIVGVGAYLTELLEERGYCVIHDTTEYDMKNGKLDRNQAYTYALDGITGILQEYPSIEVVLDLHRDGVGEGTHLVTEINGKSTAKIMFFNGTSQTPDGPIEYLSNPNREANMAFSFQMQLIASEQYPGLTRKIYLKGLRYNQHVRARTALIEVGAQTNTYAEAFNAMEPLADILCRVLDGQ